jgi:hypothetical protein
LGRAESTPLARTRRSWCPFVVPPFVSETTTCDDEEEAMKYLLLIHQGDTPTPFDPEAWGRLSEDEQQEVYAAYQEINGTPGVTPGVGMQPPELATTVRVENGRTLTTDGPFVSVKEALGGYLLYEADDLDAAIELASRVPAARMGGAVEVRPVAEW